MTKVNNFPFKTLTLGSLQLNVISVQYEDVPTAG